MPGWRAAGISDVGLVREANEDAFAVHDREGVFLVADGMGGHAAGEIASRLAAEVAAEYLLDAVRAGADAAGLDAAIAAAFATSHERLLQHSREHPGTRGMGTTLSLCVLDADGGLRIGHIGDSRVYRLRRGDLRQLTIDHTWVQREIDAGRLPAEASSTHPLSHILTRVVSEGTEPEPDMLRERLEPGDLLLLATDGLTGLVSDPELAAILSSEADLDDRLAELVEAANDAGGHDNVTAVLVDFRGG